MLDIDQLDGTYYINGQRFVDRDFTTRNHPSEMAKISDVEVILSKPRSQKSYSKK